MPSLTFCAIMAMVPTSWFLPLPSPQGSDAITTLGHAGLMQRSSLVPLLDQFSRSDFIFPQLSLRPVRSTSSPCHTWFRLVLDHNYVSRIEPGLEFPTPLVKSTNPRTTGL